MTATAEKRFSLPIVQNCFEPTRVYIHRTQWPVSLVAKRPRRETDNSLSPIAHVKNDWGYIGVLSPPPPQYASMRWTNTNILYVFYVYGSVHRWSILIIVQRDATQSHLWPRWREVAALIIWPGPKAVATVMCTPDDGCGWHPKHVEWTCRIIDRLLCVASCWTIINTALYGVVQHVINWRYVTFKVFIAVQMKIQVTCFVTLFGGWLVSEASKSWTVWPSMWRN